ncbi:MAG: hypothetical protein NT128_05835 [Proteobacteria bacterium]|nr:hypothetical protein [Pseudomonadota bacterium]
MADFGVLSAIRELLKTERDIVSEGVSEQIHISYPSKTSIFPMIILELEEVWTSMTMNKNSPKARLKLKAQTLSDKPSGKESITIAEKLRGLIDGKTIRTENGSLVTLRMENCIVDIPTSINKTRNVKQYFEAIVRG